MEILNVIVSETWLQSLLGILGALILVGAGFAILCCSVAIENAKQKVITLVTLSAVFIIGIVMLCVYSDSTTKHPVYNYEVILNDETQVNEILDDYRIIEQRGDIYVITPRDAPLL